MRWDLTTGRTTPFGPTESDSACCFALSPDSQLIAFETWNREDELTAYEVQVWSVDHGGLVYQTPRWGPDFSTDGLLSCVSGPQRDPHGCRSSCRDDELHRRGLPSFSDLMVADGSRIAAASQTDLEIYEVEEGVDHRPSQPRQGQRSRVAARR